MNDVYHIIFVSFEGLEGSEFFSHFSTGGVGDSGHECGDGPCDISPFEAVIADGL